jgi:hypothetical protein
VREREREREREEKKRREQEDDREEILIKGAEKNWEFVETRGLAIDRCGRKNCNNTDSRKLIGLR